MVISFPNQKGHALRAEGPRGPSTWASSSELVSHVVRTQKNRNVILLLVTLLLFGIFKNARLKIIFIYNIIILYINIKY